MFVILVMRASHRPSDGDVSLPRLPTGCLWFLFYLCAQGLPLSYVNWNFSLTTTLWDCWIRRNFFSPAYFSLKGILFIALIRAQSCRRKCKSVAFLLTASDQGGNLRTFCYKICQLVHQCWAANSF